MSVGADSAYRRACFDNRAVFVLDRHFDRFAARRPPHPLTTSLPRGAGPRDLDGLARIATTSAVLRPVATARWTAGVAHPPVRLARGGPRPLVADDPGATEGVAV